MGRQVVQGPPFSPVSPPYYYSPSLDSLSLPSCTNSRTLSALTLSTLWPVLVCSSTSSPRTMGSLHLWYLVPFLSTLPFFLRFAWQVGLTITSPPSPSSSSSSSSSSVLSSSTV